MEEKQDQVVDDVKKDDQSSEQSEETKEEPPTIEKLAELVKGIQKGYTLNAQAISEMKDNLQAIADQTNKQTGASSGEDEYLTVGKLKEILNQQSQEQEQKRIQANTYIDDTLAQLRIEGIIGNRIAERINKETGKKEIFDPDQEDLIQYAIDKKELDLLKAAERWQEIKEAKEEAKKEIAKTKTRQEEGSKVGTSSKMSEESKGVNYETIHNTDWSRL